MDAIRKFHLITYSDNDPNEQTVIKHNLAGFNSFVFQDGVPYSGKIPKEVKLFIDKKENPTDFLANILSWPIASKRFLDYILKYAKDDIQIFDAPVFDIHTQKRVEGFYLLNAIRLLKCVDIKNSTVIWKDKEKKELDSIIKPAFISKNIPPNIHVFRSMESWFDLVFSDELATSLIGKGLKGIAFIRTKSV